MERDTGLQYCPRCAKESARFTCRPTTIRDETLLLCGACGGVTRAVTVREERPLLSVYAEVWRYVLRGDGAIALLALSIGAWLLSFIPLLGGIAAAGVKLSYFFSVIRTSARGSDDLPHAADFTDWGDLIRPTVRSMIAFAVALGPLVAALGMSDGGASRVLAGLVGAGWAVAYLPGAMIMASLHDGCFGGANPLPVMELARRIPRDYALTAAVLLAMAIAALALAALGAMVRVPVLFVSTVVRVLIDAVVLTMPLAMARVLGLLLRERSDEVSIDD